MPIVIQPTLRINHLAGEAEAVVDLVDDLGHLAKGLGLSLPDYGPGRIDE
jgi:hypothetical protein